MFEEKKRILLFIKTPPPITGATLMNKRIHESVLLRANFNIESICISYSNNVDDLGEFKVRKLLVFFDTLFKLFLKLVFSRPKAVYYQLSPTNLAFLRDLMFIVLIKAFRVKILYHIRGQGISEQSKQHWKRGLYRYVFINADVICLSKLLTYDIKPVHNGIVHVVNNGLPEISYKWIERSLKVNNEEIELIYFSNLIISKGILDFIECLALLNIKKLPFKAKIMGANGTISYCELKTIIREKALEDKVELLGPKYSEEKHKELSKVDVLILPTKNDAFPGVIIEAMQMGIPVISTFEGAIPEIVDHNITGYLVEKDSPEQIVNYIEKFIKNPYLIYSMGMAGQKKFHEKYTFDIFEHNMLSVFSQTMYNIK